MKKVYIKHTGLPIPDLFIDYEIDAANHLVIIELNGHVDSALLIVFAQQVLEKEEGIRVLDNQSHAIWGPAQIEGRFDLALHLAGQWFDVKLVQMGPWGRTKDAALQYTVSMHHRTTPLPPLRSRP